MKVIYLGGNENKNNKIEGRLAERKQKMKLNNIEQVQMKY